MASPDCVASGFENVDPTMTMVASVSTTALTHGAVSLPAIAATWTPISSPYVTGVEFQYTDSIVAGGYKGEVVPSDRLAWDTTSSIVPSHSYSVRYRAVGSGVVGPWSNWIGVTAPATLVASSFDGQGNLATLNLVDAAVMAAASGGGNAAVDTKFYFPALYWANADSAMTGATVVSVVEQSGMRGLRKTGSGAQANGLQFNIRQQGANERLFLLPMAPTQRVEASAYVSAQAVSHAQLFITWIDASDAILGYSYPGDPISSGLTGSGNAGVASLPRCGGFATAPAFTAFAAIGVEFFTNGDPTFPPFGSVLAPLIRVAGPVQTELSAYTPGIENQLGADVTSQNVAASVTGQTGWATLPASTARVSKIDDTGRLVDLVNGAPVNLGSAQAYTYSPPDPLSSASSTSIAVAATTITMAGGSISTPAATITGLTADTTYAVFWDTQTSAYVAVSSGTTAYYTAPSRYPALGVQQTQTSTGTYTPPPTYTGGGGGGSVGPRRVSP